MININSNSQALLTTIGHRLKEARLARNESQETFGSRIGLSRQSYSKMEKGSPHISIGYWLAASEILGQLDTWQDVLAEDIDLFEQFERRQKERKRAGGKRTKIT